MILIKDKATIVNAKKEEILLIHDFISSGKAIAIITRAMTIKKYGKSSYLINNNKRVRILYY